MIVILITATAFLSAEAAQSRFKYKDSPTWTTKDGNILLYGKHIFNIRGTNWWGADGPSHVPLGMRHHDIQWHLNILRKYKFNAIRYAVAMPTVMNPSARADVSCQIEPTLCKNTTAMDFLENVIDRAGRYGIVVMLDLHSLDYHKGSELWYDDKYPESALLKAWDIMMDRFKNKWNVFAIDLKNEPHGKVTWGSGDLKTDWRLASIRIINHIKKNHPEYKGLFFVEGVCCGLNKWFRHGLDKYPVVTGDADIDKRVVYSAHHYRPGRTRIEGDLGNPLPPNATLLTAMDEAFGKVVKQTGGRPQVFGEFGDDLRNPNGMKWLEIFTGWMVKNCQNNFFYWGLGGGVPGRPMVSSKDWTTVDVPKMQFLQKVQQRPTTLKKKKYNFLVIDRGQQCG